MRETNTGATTRARKAPGRAGRSIPLGLLSDKHISLTPSYVGR